MSIPHRKCSVIFVIGICVLLAGSSFAADDEYLQISKFDYSQSKQRFDIQGTSDLPDGTRITGTISFEGSRVSTWRFVTKKSKFREKFEVSKKVLPGTYELKLMVYRVDQTSEVDEELDDEFEEAMVVKSSMIGSASAAKKERNRYREVILKEVSQVRKSYDEILQNGIRFSRQVASDSSLSADAKSKIASAWQTVWESSDLSARSRELKDEVFGIETCYAIPHLETAQMTLELIEQVHRLKCIYFYRVWKGMGRVKEVPKHVSSEGTYDPRNVLARVNAVALRIQSLMKAEKPIWEPLIKVAKERGSYGGKDRNTYTSSVSGFQITRASSNWKWDLGAKNSPMRLSVNYSMKGIGDEELVQHLIQVNKVEFKWAESPEEIAQAWEQLAEYEWPNYQKLHGQFVEVGEGDNVQKVYLFRFRTRSPNLDAEVECHLFFPVKEENRGVVYGLLHLSMAEAMDHHMSDEKARELMGGTEDKKPFQVMVESFRIRE